MKNLAKISNGVNNKKLKIETNKQVKKDWLEPEGELVVDLYETEKDLVLQSAIAGIKPEDLDIVIEKDLLRIKGRRENSQTTKEKKYFLQEVYWGPFFREIFLPKEIDPLKIEAKMEEGILIIKIPKIRSKRKRKIKVEER